MSDGLKLLMDIEVRQRYSCRMKREDLLETAKIIEKEKRGYYLKNYYLSIISVCHGTFRGKYEMHLMTCVQKIRTTSSEMIDEKA